MRHVRQVNPTDMKESAHRAESCSFRVYGCVQPCYLALLHVVVAPPHAGANLVLLQRTVVGHRKGLHRVSGSKKTDFDENQLRILLERCNPME